jgi:hypothetical protein
VAAFALLASLATAVPPAYGHGSALDSASVGIESVPSGCPGKADGSFGAPQVITGEFGTEMERAYVLLPFAVAQGTTAVRVRYCYDQPEAPTNSQIKHVLDLGLYDALGPDGSFDENEFRGWGGSSHPDVTVSPNGFSDDATYTAAPKEHVHGRTTRGFEPGPVPAGTWAVELGVAAVASQREGDSDGKVAWRVEIYQSSSSSWANEPYQPTPYDATPARTGPGWYAGDFHVHAEHSSLGDATMREAFNYAFAPLARDCSGCPQTGAGLDFITLSDYVTDTAWGEIGRFQPDYPGKLVIRSSEVITYHGHTNNHASVRYVDYRTGPVYQRAPDGTLSLVRAARPASAIFDAVHAGGGFTQINHPTIFPSEVPGFDFICRGCPWDYSSADTDYSKVDAIEVATGPAGLHEDPQPGPNPFTPLAIRFWEDAIDAGGLNRNKIAAVGSSDSHKAGRFSDLPDIPSAPIGQATTVVYADELSERGIQRGVEAGHTYVKVFGNDGPDVRLEATVPGSGDPPAIMGDTIHASSAEFTARVLGAGPSAARPGDYELFVLKDGAPLLATPVVGDDFSFPFPSVGPGRYRLQVQRDSAIEDVSSPIYLEPAVSGYPRPKGATPLLVSLVTAYEPCSEANSTHGAPLSAPSCSPPRPASAFLTVGTPDANGKAARSIGQVRYDVVAGDVGTGADEADVKLTVSLADVRRRGDLADYDGELLADAAVRLTDRRNGGDAAAPGTATDVEFPFTVPCAATSDPGVGSLCSVSTSADAVLAGTIDEGARATWELGQLRVDDGGSDGSAATTGDNTPFARQGVFIP